MGLDFYSRLFSPLFSHALSQVYVFQEGIFTIFFGLSAFFLLPKSLDHAKFLNSDEKNYLKEQLNSDGMTDSNPSDQFNWADIVNAFKSPHVVLIAITGFFGGSTQGGLA
jgi:hypothetical protein